MIRLCFFEEEKTKLIEEKLESRKNTNIQNKIQEIKKRINKSKKQIKQIKPKENYCEYSNEYEQENIQELKDILAEIQTQYQYEVSENSNEVEFLEKEIRKARDNLLIYKRVSK